MGALSASLFLPDVVARVCAAASLVAYAACSVALSVFDARDRRIPNALVLVLALSALVQMGTQAPFGGAAGASVLAFWLGPAGARLAWAAGVIVVAGGAELVARNLRGGRHSLGLGDVKLLAAEALWLGEGVLFALALACVSAALVEGLLRRRRAFAFGPYIALASGACLVMRCLFAGVSCR